MFSTNTIRLLMAGHHLKSLTNIITINTFPHNSQSTTLSSLSQQVIQHIHILIGSNGKQKKRKWIKSNYLYLQWVAHLHAILRPFDGGRGGGGVGRLAPGVGVRGGADDDGLVDLHDGSLDGGGEGAVGGRAHVHHHAALGRGDLVGREGVGKGGEKQEYKLLVWQLH